MLDQSYPRRRILEHLREALCHLHEVRYIADLHQLKLHGQLKDAQGIVTQVLTDLAIEDATLPVES